MIMLDAQSLPNVFHMAMILTTYESVCGSTSMPTTLAPHHPPRINSSRRPVVLGRVLALRK
ncbi:hypothetical protein LZ30DRAFT_710767 [Colletotrichum cereale]|nr:hypothetical protein LZ30DRAFT_710767 [Colletotrichum cereale]